MNSIQNPVNIIVFFTLLTLLPVIIVLTTSFIKISMVLILTRESLGVQQVPPNIVIYGLSLILSCYVMGPIYNNSFQSINNTVMQGDNLSSKVLIQNLQQSAAPVKKFLIQHSAPTERYFFYRSLKQFWTADMMKDVKNDDILVLIPAFVVAELTQAFKIGFLMYLPAVILDIIVSNILMAMGMMMVSPTTISLPIKLLLFISLDGWSRLIHALLSTYV